MPCLEEASIADVLLPNAKDLSDSIALEESNVSDDIEQSGLMHPIRKSNDFSRKEFFLPLGLELFLQALGIDLNNSMGRDGVVLVKGGFLLILISSDDLEVVGAELLRI